jgi:hypothetical protein
MGEKLKHTKWLNKVVANVSIDEETKEAIFYLGVIEVDRGRVTPDGILRKNGVYVKDAWEWMNVIERNLLICF